MSDEQILTVEQFEEAKQLAIQLVRSMSGQTYTTAQLMAAAGMFMAGFVYKETYDDALLQDAATVHAQMFVTAVRELQKTAALTKGGIARPN